MRPISKAGARAFRLYLKPSYRQRPGKAAGFRRFKDKAGRYRSERGYTYVAVMIILVALAMGAQVATIPAHSALVRNDEAELLFRGQAYIAALESYQNAIEGDKSLPQKLEELLDDRRSGRRRHIRRLYDDPLTGGAWKILRNGEGRIHGVASTAPGAPRKKAFFPEGMAGFAAAKTYAGWEFVYKDKAPGGG